jgi:hypothetical protein
MPCTTAVRGADAAWRSEEVLARLCAGVPADRRDEHLDVLSIREALAAAAPVPER